MRARYPGVADVRAYSREESARLLEPWLGTGLSLDDLPVPRLIVVRLEADAPDLCAVAQAARRAGAVREPRRPSQLCRAHARHGERGRCSAGIAVLTLVLIATVLSVMFATRGAMAANRTVIEVLHFIGAKNGFIAGHFQRHFLRARA